MRVNEIDGRWMASCADCGWEGRRKWPSTIRPCPKCKGRTIGRLIDGPHGWHTCLPWED